MFFLQFNKFTQCFTALGPVRPGQPSSPEWPIPVRRLCLSVSPSVPSRCVQLQHLMQCFLFPALALYTIYICTICAHAVLNLATNDSLINCHTVMRFKLSCLYSTVRRLSPCCGPPLLFVAWLPVPGESYYCVGGRLTPDVQCPIADGWCRWHNGRQSNVIRPHRNKEKYL